LIRKNKSKKQIARPKRRLNIDLGKATKDKNGSDLDDLLAKYKSITNIRSLYI
jgi:hypothetical protein